MAKDIFGDDTTKPLSDFESLLNNSISDRNRHFEKGEKLKAKIYQIGKDAVYVLVGNMEAYAKKADFENKAEDLSEGDEITLYFQNKEGDLLFLSPKISGKALSDSIEEAFDTESAIEGKITEVVNGGVRVQIMGKLAFCPISQIDNQYVEDAKSYIGRKMNFVITKFEQGGRNIVVSGKKAIEQERLLQESDFMERFKEGDELNAQITRIEKFGVFAKIAEGVEGLVHISELSWTRIAHPSEMYKVNDALRVRILKIEEDDKYRLKISLSAKAAGEDPWMSSIKNFSVGQVYPAKIKDKQRFGILMELSPGIIGLLSKNSIRESMQDAFVQDKEIGDSFNVMIQSISIADKRMALNLPNEQDTVSAKDFSSNNKGFSTLESQLKNLKLK